MTAPTPADIRRRILAANTMTLGGVALGTTAPEVDRTSYPVRFFAPSYPRGAHTPPAAWRARARDEAIAAAERLARELSRLRPLDELDLDLRIESYRRAAARLDDALDAFDDALADPAGPPVPPPTARDL